MHIDIDIRCESDLQGLQCRVHDVNTGKRSVTHYVVVSARIGDQCRYKHSSTDRAAVGEKRQSSTTEMLQNLAKKVATFKVKATTAESTTEQVAMERSREDIIKEIHGMFMFKLN